MNKNRLRELLKAGKPSLGTRISAQWPMIAELVGSSGNFDYIEYVAEYSPFDQYDLENIPRACELTGMGCMLKVDFQNRKYVAQKAIASGFQAILFTDHKIPEEVKDSITAVKADEPSSGGRFGYPNRRFIGCQPYLSQLDHVKRVNEVVICFMIEKKEAMDNIEEICSIPGVDMVQFGPSDYSMSMGKNKSDMEEECKAAERKMIEVALKYDVQPRCEIYGGPEQVKYYLDLGVKHICFGDEMKIYKSFLENEGKYMREVVDKIK
ncbi:MAG: 2,4-dihydroxyhept-2-ene-1,7-dioic acid aldolase [Candidatus Cloacimonas sp. SDB]|nr:MAG: 2,4-dihydroxyhept-2-ene-1,7-dioic acid aldolase [Candidatus Cloacimonas sp. SDB]